MIEPEVDVIKEKGIIEWVRECFEYHILDLAQGLFEACGEQLSLEQINEHKKDFIAALYLVCVDLELNESMIKQCHEKYTDDSIYKQYIDKAASDDSLYSTIVFTICGTSQINFDVEYYHEQLNYMNDYFLT